MKIYQYGIFALTCISLSACSDEGSEVYPDYEYTYEDELYRDVSPSIDEATTLEEFEAEVSEDEFLIETEKFQNKSLYYSQLTIDYSAKLLSTFYNLDNPFELKNGLPMTFEEFRQKIDEHVQLTYDFADKYESNLGVERSEELRSIAEAMKARLNSEITNLADINAINEYKTLLESSGYADIVDLEKEMPETVKILSQSDQNLLMSLYLLLNEAVRTHGNSALLLDGHGPEILARVRQALESIHQQLSKN